MNNFNNFNSSKEQERYYARKNREMDRFEAHSKSSVYAEKAANRAALNRYSAISDVNGWHQMLGEN